MTERDEVEASSAELDRVYSVIENALYSASLPTNELLSEFLGAPVVDLQPYVVLWFSEFGPVLGDLPGTYAAAFAAMSRPLTRLPASTQSEVGSPTVGQVKTSTPFLKRSVAFSAIHECVRAGLVPSLCNVRCFVGHACTDVRIKRCITSWLNQFSGKFADDVRTARMSIITGRGSTWDEHVERKRKDRAGLH